MDASFSFLGSDSVVEGAMEPASPPSSRGMRASYGGVHCCHAGCRAFVPSSRAAMASCCISSLVLPQAWPRRIEASGRITPRSGTHKSTTISERKETRLRAQLDEWQSSGTSSDELNARLARDDLLGLIAGEERGLRTQKDARKRDEIVKAIDALAVLGKETVTTDESLSATWRMLWTTEKEQLFIVEKAHLFSTEAGGIFQVIDVGSCTLNNVITFPPTGLFLVNSTIAVESAQRVSFKFTSASLRVGGRKIPFPPFGQAWFESVYLDDKIRVALDIRGDYLVVDRAPNALDLS